MKVTRDQVARNRQNILASAARLFRNRGFGAVSLADVMKDAGLTHGAFYGHFQSREDLMAQAIFHSAGQQKEYIAESIADNFRKYLSIAHVENRTDGCLFAALAGDTSPQSAETRHEMTDRLRYTIDQLVGLTAVAGLPTRSTAIATFSTLVGALVLARLVDDPEFAEEILSANRETL
ncbi:TetR/AcrR family transcriptional regulator [Undibacterium sp. TJN25]|uniref:TetR/AcrR family transcriptional regulator n=1 Tax=Undibacterium sp. TJN25 TaxID=3413056 RepID=UPI003BEF578A